MQHYEYMALVVTLKILPDFKIGVTDRFSKYQEMFNHVKTF